MSFADLLDGAIATLAPAWAARRKFARFALDEADRFAAYREGNPSRLDRSVTSRGTSADWELELGFDRRQIVDRARMLERDNLLAGALLDRSGEFVVGEGFRVKSRSKDAKWNEAADAIWKDWCENQADVRGLDAFDDLLELIYRSWLRDGDIAIVLNADGSIRLVESDEIASPQGGYSRPSMADGVELDPHGKPLAFWIFDPDPNVLYADRRVALNRLTRVPAKNVIFLARRLRAGQTRGISVFNGMIWLLEQLDGTLEAVTVAHRMAALFALVVKKKAPFSGAMTRTDSGGTTRPQLNFEPGSVMRLEPDEDVTQITPAHPGSTSSQHMRDLGRLATSRFGTTIEFVIGDLTTSNYSNARTGLILAKKSRLKKQKRLGRVVRDLRNWRILRAMESGELSVRRDALAHTIVYPGMPWIDPTAEVQAALAAVDGNLDTLANVAAEHGMDLDDVLSEREQELSELALRKIPVVRSTLTRDPTPEPKPEKPSAETKAHEEAVRGELAQLREDLGQVVDGLREVLARPSAPPPAGPTINLSVPERATTVENHNHVATPDVNVTNHVEAPPAPPPAAMSVNVDVNAQIRGSSKTLEVKRNDAGDVTGINVTAKDE
jgi:lambda family phage portal protein